MLSRIANALAATGRLDIASVLIGALAFRYNGIGDRLTGRHSDGLVSGNRDSDNFNSDNAEAKSPDSADAVGPRPCDRRGDRAAIVDRFPGPWWIVEIPTGCVVNDAAGQQLGVFYGRDDSNAAGHTGYLTMGEARQLAADFVRLPELLKRESGA
jgi:hypothetical protein